VISGGIRKDVENPKKTSKKIKKRGDLLRSFRKGARRPRVQKRKEREKLEQPRAEPRIRDKKAIQTNKSKWGGTLV